MAAALGGCGSGSAATPPPAPAPPAELTPAVYTAEQASRGQRVFGRVCSVCHGRNEFRGPIFALTWIEEPVGHLFQHISTTMPQDDPGSLSLEEYVSIVAYFLQLNEREAGDRELPVDPEALNTMSW